MRILLVEPDLFDSGAPRVNLDRAQRWQQAGHTVTVFVIHPQPTETDLVPPAGLRVVWGTRRDLRLRWRLALAVLQLVALARRHDVVVVGREVGDSLLCSTAAAQVARRPVAVTVHARLDLALETYVPARQRGLSRRALRSADRAVCVAAALVPVLVEVGVPRDRVRVVTNGVDVAALRRAAAEPAPVELPAGPFLAATGRLHRQKGFDLLLRAHQHALSIGAPPHAVVVLGTGADRNALVELASELGVRDSVHLAGFVTNPHAVVARSDLFVLSSRFEGYPLALVEALALGVPAVAADVVSGPREVMDGNAFGELVPPEDPVALGAAIARHLHDPADLRARARAAAQAAPERYDPQAAADAHLRVLEDLLRP